MTFYQKPDHFYHFHRFSCFFIFFQLLSQPKNFYLGPKNYFSRPFRSMLAHSPYPKMMILRPFNTFTLSLKGDE